MSAEPGLAHFLTWFEGEYDNNEQVWQQREDGLDEASRHEHIHHIFRSVSVPALGQHVMFVRQYMDGDYENVYRQRLYQFSEEGDIIRLSIYRFKDEGPYRDTDRDPSLVEALTKDQLIHRPGCDVLWQWHDDRYVGEMPDGQCRFYSERQGKTIIIDDTLQLSATELQISDRAVDEEGNTVFGRDTPHVNRKVRYFRGWALIDHAHLAAAGRSVELEPGAKNVNFFSGLRLHNEGDVIELVTENGEPSGYAIELAQLTYANTGTAILKLALIEQSSGKSIAYLWSDPEAVRIGVNLRWFQVGLTAEPGHERQ